MRKDAKIAIARRLRKQLTKPEAWLWVRLRYRSDNALFFRKQHPIGLYILDFYCPKAKLCVEVDGMEHTFDKNRARDAIRDEWLTEQGIYTHRIVARDLLADPDATAQGVMDLALERSRLV